MTWNEPTDTVLIEKGHPACAGCGMILSVRHLLEVAGEDSILVIPASCAAVVQGVYPNTAFDVPVVNTAFAAGPSTASGIKMALESRGEDTNVIVLAGDGGSVDIGLSALSGALERDHDITYVLYDNEAYSNTGFQKSGRTPTGARTTTTPTGHVGKQKDIGAIVADHDPAYFATASPGYLRDLRSKMERALAADGMSVLHLHSPCPPGWQYPTADTVTVAELAVESALWVLYERERGGAVTINPQSRRALRDPAPFTEYLDVQGRFDGTDDVTADVQAAVDMNRERFSAYLEESA